VRVGGEAVHEVANLGVGFDDLEVGVGAGVHAWGPGVRRRPEKGRLVCYTKSHAITANTGSSTPILYIT